MANLTCTITKAGRFDEYGRALTVGQSYTGSFDFVRDLYRTGYCTVANVNVFDDDQYPNGQAAPNVSAVTDPVTGRIKSLQSSGASEAFLPNSYQAGSLSSPSINVAQMEIDPLNTTPLVNPILQTTYPADASIVHPSVIDTATTDSYGWNGYRYWMAITPLAGGDNSTENPSIMVSDDGRNFYAPPGLSNPLFTPSPLSNYYSDPYLQLMPDRSALLLTWRQTVGANEQLWISTSINGVSWTTPKSIYNASGASNVLSPSLIWNGSAWELWVTNNSASWQKYTSSKLGGAWTGPTAITPTLPTGETAIWHSELRRKADGSYYGLVQTTTIGAQGRVYLCTSTDGAGANFTFSSPCLPHQQGYKSSFCPSIAQDGSVGGLLYLNCVSWNDSTTLYVGDSIYVCPVTFDNTKKAASRAMKVDLAAAFGAASPGILLCDNFTRGNNASSLGSASTGQAWTNTNGAFGISSNQAYCATPNQANRSIIDVGSTDYWVELTIGTPGSGATFEHYLLVKYVDSSNFLTFGTQGNPRFDANYRVSGVSTGLFTNAARTMPRQVLAGDRIGALVRGNKIRYFFNGSICAVVDASYLTAIAPLMSSTKIGIQHTATTAGTTFSSLIVQPLS